MSRLNEPREIPYAFKVVELDGIVWLFDDSTRTFIASANPTIWMEPLYTTEPSVEEPCPKCVLGQLEHQDDCVVCTSCKEYWLAVLLPGLQEADCFSARIVETLTNYEVQLDDEDIAPSVSEKDAWDAAREEANGNHLI